MKSKKTQTASELMTLEGDAIPHPVRKKRGGLRLKAKHHRRLKKALAVGSAFAILVGGTFGINAIFFNKAAPNVVDVGFETVKYDVPSDGSTPDLHSALENIGYMNARFCAQPVWYSEMGGTVDTMLKQSVNTWKQYADGVLIQTDITTSSLVNSAKQFCWVGDRVIWREAAGGPSTYDGINTAWKDGEPFGNMSVEEFKATRGLPGTSFSVYVINEETLLDATAVTDNGDGTYTQTYYLDPATDKAPAYYVNQMMFTGGLTSLPVFEYITVTYTFDATWQVLSSEIEEAYTATKGVNARCTATYRTVYEYGTDRAYSTAYDDYFKNYADKPATGAPSENTLTAVDCLAEAFGAVLTKPVTFAVDLTLNGESYSGLVYVDVSDMSDISIRASLGNIFLQYAGDEVFLRYGNGVKMKLSVDELAALLSSLIGDDAAGEGISFDTDALLSQLGGGTFEVAEDGKSATLVSELSLFGLRIPVRFAFNVSESGVSLDTVSAEIALSEEMQIGAQLAFSQESVPALSEQEKTQYVPLIPYVEHILDIVSGEAVSLDLNYAGKDFSVAGKIDVMFKDAFLVQGSLKVGYLSASKQLDFAFRDGVVFLDVDGIRLRADVDDAIALIKNFVTLPELPSSLPAIDLGGLLNTVLSQEFANNFAISETDGTLGIAIKGTQLLKTFGIDFTLGDVSLGIGEEKITASALGVQLALSKGAAFSFSDDGYIDAVGLANDVLGLLTQDYLTANLSYAAGDLSVSGTVTLDMAKFAAKGTVTLNYKSACKTVEILYADGAIYLGLEGIRLKASIDELVALLSEVLGGEIVPNTPEGDLLEQVLSLNFAELVKVTESDGTVEVLVKGTELLKAFGIDFNLGEVSLAISDGKLTASALGAQAEIVPGEAFSYTTDGYIDAVGLANDVLGLLTQDYLTANLSYAAGDLSVSGTVTLDMAKLAAKGTVTLNYKSACKTVEILYADGAIYLELEGIKLKANVDELAALLSEVLGGEIVPNTPEGDLLEQVLSLNFAELVKVTESDGTVEVLVKGTQLLKAFGIDFTLGDVSLAISDGKLTASALGAQAEIVPGEAFSYTTDGYIDAVGLANDVLGLLTQDYLTANLSYAAGDLSVSGTVTLDMAKLAAKGTVTFNYKSACKTVEILYADGAIYLGLEGIKLKASIDELAALLSEVLGGDIMPGTPEGDLLAQVLSLNFAELVKVTESDGTVEVLVKGTELLKAFGIDFTLGDVSLAISDGKLTASALGAQAEIVPGEAFSYTTDGYIDAVGLANDVLGLLTQDYLTANLSYAAGDLSVSGTVTLDMAKLAAKGTVTLNYKSACKTVEILYADGAIYLGLEGIRLKASIDELVALLSEVLGGDILPGTPEGDLLEQVLSLNFAELVKVTESDGTVEVLVKGTELLKAFGIEFNLGEVSLAISEGKLTASALGAQAEIVPGEAFSYTTDGYIDAVGLANDVLGLLTQDYLTANLSYAAGDLSVSGTVTLDMAKLAAKGTVTLNYKSACKTVEILYADGAIYLELEGIKLKANVDELAALLSEVLGGEIVPNTPEGDLLEQVLSLNFAELVKVTESDGTVEVLVKGTQLLKAFGIDFNLGEVSLAISEGRLTASALGAQAEIVPGEAFSYTTDGYSELSPAIGLLGTAIRDGRIALDGSLKLRYKDMTLGVAVRNGVLAWKDAFALRLDLVITVNGTEQTILVDADGSRVRLVYGTVGVELRYDELYQLSDTFEGVYTRIASVLNGSVAGKSLPERAEELSAAIGAGAAVTDLIGSLDLPSLIGGITFGGATGAAGSIGTLSYSSFVFDLIVSDGVLSLALGETSVGDVRLMGTLGVSAAERAPQTIEQSGLMTVADLCELLDFAGAAVGTLASPDVTISFTGATLDANANDVFDISGELVYHSGLAGSGFPIVIDVDGKTITVNPDAYIYFRLVLDDKRADGTDLYLDFWMLDAGDDGELDLYVTISKYEEGDPNYHPLRFAVPASGIMTLLSSGISLAEGKLAQFLTGLDLPQETVDALFSTLDSFFVSKWLTDTDKAQLGALGNILMGTLGIDAALEDVLSGLNDTVGGALDEAAAVDPGKYLSALGVKRGEDGMITFYVTLNSDLIYGGDGLAPLTIALTKQAGEAGSLLTGISLENIWGRGNSETTSVGFGFSFAPVTLTESADKTSAELSFEKDASTLTRTLSYADYAAYTFTGADELIKSIAASATHETQDGYALNESFFISGTANVSIGSWNAVTINVDGLSVRVNEEGEIALNLKISYSKEGLVGNLAFASSGTSELTMKDGMFYLCRNAGGKTEYRVMPAANFFASIMDQLVFLLNFSSFVQGLIPTDSEDTAGGAGTDDYGIVLSEVLTNYRYTQGETGSTWALTLNGSALTGVLEDIVITLGSTQYAGFDNILRTLDVDTALSVLGITANLMFRNPCNVWEEGYSDTTQDISAVFGSAEEIASFDWSAQAEDFYLVPQQSTVYFAVDGTQVASQNVWYSGSMLLSALNYPDLSAYAPRDGYTLAWKDFTFTPGGTAEAAYLPNLYDVTIVAPVNVGGNWKDNGDGTYSYTTQMYYGETLTLTWGDNQAVFTVGMQNNVFDLGAAIGGDSVLWNEVEADILTSGSTVRVPLTPDTVVYTSEGVTFTLGTQTGTSLSAEFDALYTLATPVAEGYLFLGWYVWDGNAPVRVETLSYAGGGVQTTVSALWLSNLTDGAIDTSKKGSWFSYDQTISVRASGGQLVGEYAQSFEVTASVDMTLKWNLTSYDLDFSNFTITQTADGWQAGAATAHTPVSDPTVNATLTVNVLLGGQSVGSANVSLSKKC